MSQRATTQTCTQCGVVKSLDQYQPHPKAKSGRLNVCIACMTAATGERRMARLLNVPADLYRETLERCRIATELNFQTQS